MDSNMQWLIDDLLDGESIENFTPKSKLEAYVKAALLKSGTDGLDIPVNRLDALLYWNADKAPDNYASAVEEGKTQAWNEFWDDFQNYGKRTGYAYGFAGWSELSFKPKYDIKPTGNANWLFEGVRITNLTQRFKDCGVVLDTSKVVSFSESFAYTNYLTHIPTLDTRGAGGALNYTFCNDRGLIEIEKIILKDDGSQTIKGSVFGSCTALETITFEGAIGANIDFHWSPKLSHDSLMSIINHLKDYSEDTSGTVYTLTLHATAKARLTEAEIAIATEKGWTVA